MRKDDRSLQGWCDIILQRNIDTQAKSEGLAISRLNQLRPRRKLNGKPINQKGKQINYPHVRSKSMAIENESRQDKFKRIAVKRTSNALRAIRLIGNLATSAYSYSPEQVQKIETALIEAVSDTMLGFNQAKITKPVFSL